jgi:gamma-butyrobetaine dioxygenase
VNEGFAVWHEPAWADAVAAHPREVARAVAARLGHEVRTLERQPIRAVEGGRSFASSDGPAPLHSDSQLFHGRPAHLQVLFCVRAADRGGATLLADTRALERAVAARDPALLDALYRTPRSFPFVFGDFVASTVSSVEEDTFFTHSPRANDPVGEALLRHLRSLRTTELTLRAGEVLVVDNHRMLHGRTAFEGGARELQRLLIWLARPLVDDARRARARREGTAPRRTGVAGAAEALDRVRRRALVDELRRGVPPGVLAARHRLPEAWLYVFRDEELP